jgi:hypothetical protein
MSPAYGDTNGSRPLPPSRPPWRRNGGQPRAFLQSNMHICRLVVFRRKKKRPHEGSMSPEHGDTIDSPSPSPSPLWPWRLKVGNESQIPIFDFWAAILRCSRVKWGASVLPTTGRV